MFLPKCVLTAVAFLLKLSDTQAAAPVLDNFLLFVDGPQGRLFQMSLDEPLTTLVELPLRQPQNPVAVDYDPAERLVYWTDIESHTIRRMRLDGGGGEEEPFVMLTPASSPEGLALDPVSKLLFYTDNGRNTINVVQTETREHKVLITYAKHPRSIQTDPVNRHIYWTDWGLGSVERATYSGQERTIVVHGNDRWINGLALHLSARTLYWTDAQRGTIERANLDGTNKTVLIGESTYADNVTSITRPHYYGITVDGGFMYYTDWMRGIFRANIDGTGRHRLTTSDTPGLNVFNGIKVYRSESYRASLGPASPCRQNNGGCGGFCLPLSGGYVCECPDFKRLAADNVTCIDGVNAEGPDIVWVEQDGTSTSYVRGVRGEPRDFLRTRDILTWSIRSPAWRWTALDMDYSRRKLYLADKIDRYLVELSMNGSLDLKVVLSGTSSAVNGIAVDWVAGNVYWTDGLYKWIAVARAEPKARGHRTLLSTGLDRPHGIAVWPQKGLMFWSDWGTESKIQYSTLLGEKVTTLVSTDLFEPKGLALDYDIARLFWCNRNSIESIYTNGSHRLTHAASPINNFIGLALHLNYIIATEQGREGQESRLWVYDRLVTENSGFKLELNRQPNAVIMYDARRQEATQTPCAHMGCEHLCITTDTTSAQCVCYDGFNIAGDKQHCIENQQLLHSPAFIYSVGDKICSTLIKHAQSNTPLPDRLCFFDNPSSAYEFRALEFNHQRGELFFSETRFKVKSIRKAHLVEKQNNSAIIHGVGLVPGIAFDWVAENLYWTDHDLNQIWMSRSDGRYQKIIAKNLAGPHGIVVDQTRKKLYWCEKGGIGKIVQSNLDGTKMETLYGHVEHPTGLDIEYSQREDRLYWTDSGKNTIESLGLMSMTHKVERIPVHQGKVIVDVASYQDFLAYTSSELGNISSLHVFEKLDEKEVNRGIRHYAQTQPFGVVAFSELKQPMYNRPLCGYSDNGGCEQLMIQTLDGPCVCTCADGFVLDRDNKACRPKRLLTDNFFLVADDYRYQIYQLDADFSQVSAIRFPPLDRPISLEYDFEEERVYWTDFETNVIKRSYLDGSSVEVIHHQQRDSRIDGMAIASKSRLLYYVDSERKLVAVMTLNGKFQKVLVKLHDSSPKAIVLDEQQGLMFIALRNLSEGRIDRCGMDGTKCSPIVQFNSSWPTGLVLSHEDKLVYWCDSHTERIESARFDGTEQSVIYSGTAREDPFSVTLQGAFVYWTDWNVRGISRLNRTAGGQHERKFHTFFRGLNDVKFYNRTSVNAIDNACVVNNGGCSHFCVPTLYNGHICMCPDPKDASGTESFNCEQKATVAVCPNTFVNGRIQEPCTFSVGATCQFTCNPGYGATTKEPIACQHDLQWSKDIARLCIDATCPMLMNADNAIVDASCPVLASVGVTCSQRCVDGYSWTGGDLTQTCGFDLRWTGRQIVCTPSSCSELVTPPHAVLDGPCPTSRASPGTHCLHRCVTGYSPTGGDSVRVCDKQLRWKGTNIKCARALRCPALSAPLHSIIEPPACVMTSLSTNQECRQTCRAGFSSNQGNVTRVCAANQTWSSGPIVCSNETVVENERSSSSSSSNSKVGSIVGLTVGMLLVSAIVLGAIILFWRLWMPRRLQTGLSFLPDLSQFRFTRGLEDDLQPVVDPAPVFFSKTGKTTVQLDFDNPVYDGAMCNTDPSALAGTSGLGNLQAGISDLGNSLDDAGSAWSQGIRKHPLENEDDGLSYENLPSHRNAGKGGLEKKLRINARNCSTVSKA